MIKIIKIEPDTKNIAMHIVINLYSLIIVFKLIIYDYFFRTSNLRVELLNSAFGL